MKHLISVLIMLGGVGCAAFYLRRLPEVSDPTMRALVANRPWRRLGAAICLVLAIMFVLGIYFVDMPHRAGLFAIYWMIMLALVLWLCYLAIKDIVHTRRIIADWRDADRQRPSETISPTGRQEP